MTKFLLNMGYQWGDGVEHVDGYIFNASAITAEQALRRPFDYYHGQWLLLDPQLYLASLDDKDCGPTCAKLATYPWFGVPVPGYDSTAMTQKEWLDSVKKGLAWHPSLPTTPGAIRDVIRECFEFQQQFTCTHFIIPTPLVDNPDDEFSVQLKWLEAAATLRKEYKKPMLATVALAEHVLTPHRPQKSRLVQAILDNLTVSEFEGTYLLVVRKAGETVRLLDNHAVESLLYISHLAGAMAHKSVVLNFADDLGYACLAAGATAFAGGATNKQRRICLSDFVERKGGPAYPRLYSHSLIGDFLTQSDLTKIRDVRLLKLLDHDITGESRPLIEALKAGRDANSVPSWRQSQNNVATAQRHRSIRLHDAAIALGKLPAKDRLTAVLTWVKKAEANSALLDKHIPKPPLSETGRHLPAWRSSIKLLLDYLDESDDA